MKHLTLIIVVLLGNACSRKDVRPQSLADSVVAVVGVTVIPMDSERVLPEQTVLIRNGLILELAPADSLKIPPGARRIEGAGLYLVPGLTDAHVHLRDTSELLSYLAHGVTTVVHLSGPSGNLPDVLGLRAKVAEGEVLGPVIFASGRIIDGSPPIFAGVSTAVESPEEARRVVKAQVAAGADLIKVYNNLPSDALLAVTRTAHELGVPVWGHIPRIDGRDSALHRALAAGLDVIAHGEELFFTLLHRTIEEQLDRGKVPKVSPALIAEAVRLVQESGAAVIPNLSFVSMTRAQLEDIAAVSADPEARFLHPMIREMWEQQNPTRRSDLSRFDLRERGKAAVLKTLTRALHRAGVLLLLGSDASAPAMYPGKSAHIELKELVAAGLTPYQALATGTRNAGSVIGGQLRGATPFGTVAVGSRADLLLLRGNPVLDIRNIEAIAGVLVNGEWYPRAALDSLRAQRTSH